MEGQPGRPIVCISGNTSGHFDLRAYARVKVILTREKGYLRDLTYANPFRCVKSNSQKFFTREQEGNS
jgi:hypothetical protein